MEFQIYIVRRFKIMYADLTKNNDFSQFKKGAEKGQSNCYFLDMIYFTIIKKRLKQAVFLNQ